MANYRAIVKHHPEVREYIRLRKWVHRGEIVAYAPNIESDVLSTDANGYRNGKWQGARLTLADCLVADRFGLVMGSSNVYGFGAPHDGHTIPSRLGELLGLRLANISLPEAHSRNLFAILLGVFARSPRLPSVVVLLTGGDFTSWTYRGLADPVFGPTNLLQSPEKHKRPADLAAGCQAMLASSQLWTMAIAQLCRSRGVPLMLGNDTTFFEKEQPDSYDRDCALGVASAGPQQRQFDIHRNSRIPFYRERQTIAGRLGVPLAGPGPGNQIGFIDEFHYDAAGIDALCGDFAPAVGEALGRGGK